MIEYYGCGVSFHHEIAIKPEVTMLLCSVEQGGFVYAYMLILPCDVELHG